MENEGKEEVTRILQEIEEGESNAAEKLLPLVYQELRRLAASQMAREKPGHTLQPTALVHEAYIRLVERKNQKWEDRRHFFASAAEAMRRILVDNARRKNRARRGGGWKRVDFDKIDIAVSASDEDLLALDEALIKLQKEDSLSAELIKLRFFVGLTNIEAAKILGLSERTAKRNWAYARAWLLDELKKEFPY